MSPDPHSLPKPSMTPSRQTLARLLDRTLIGLLLFIVMVMLGIQAVHTG